MKALKYLLIIILSPIIAYTQNYSTTLDSNKTTLGVKTNLAYLTAFTPNLGLELNFKEVYSLEFMMTYNAWDLEENKKWKNLMMLGEMKFWQKTNTKGHFLGIQAGFVQYNIGSISLPYYKEAFYYRYDGWLIGMGLTYGHKWEINNKWAFEASAGIGVMYADYDKYLFPVCGAFWGEFHSFLLVPTKLSFSLIYYIN